MTDDANDKRAKGLARMREPFPPHQISKLPKATKVQTEALKSDRSLGIRCTFCGQWHHKDVAHLDYVGHAALTDRLLECDQEWNWEPVATTPTGAPFIDKDGMWIKLTVCGVTRFGFGDAQGKTGGDAVKEIIGDALRNAAMRFGAALDLWHKGELHIEDSTDDPDGKDNRRATEDAAELAHERAVTDAQAMIESAVDLQDLQAVWKAIMGKTQADRRVIEAKDKRKAELSKQGEAA